MPSRLIISIAAAATLAFAIGTVLYSYHGVTAQTLGNPPPEPHNVILIVADDVGVDMVNAYTQHYEDPTGQNPPLLPCTPNLDLLATDGVRFTNAWASPNCSPTRSMIMTGMLPSKSGIGGVVNANAPGLRGLDDTIFTIGDLVSDDAFFGKWHIADQSQWPSHPTKCGFNQFAGTPVGPRWPISGNYSRWAEWNGQDCDYEVLDVNVNGPGDYSTNRITTNAIDFIQNATGNPWFLQVSYHAAHSPFHCPDNQTENCPAPSGPCETDFCADCTPGDRVEQARAMVQSMDHFIGEIMAVADDNTVIIFIGDNGTPGVAVAPPWEDFKAKGSMFQGGINVPFIIRPPAEHGIKNVVCNELVAATDIFATVADFLDWDLDDLPAENREESNSLRHYVEAVSTQESIVRGHVFSEKFGPGFRPEDDDSPPDNHLIYPPSQRHRRAIRNDKYKLIEQHLVGSEQVVREMYSLHRPDLLPGEPLPHDPAILDEVGSNTTHSAFELVNLYNNPKYATEQAALEALMLSEYGNLFEKAGREVLVPATELKTSSKVVIGTPESVSSPDASSGPPIVGHQCSETDIMVGYEQVTDGHLVHRTFMEFDLSMVLDEDSDVRWAFLDVIVANGSSDAITVEVLDAPVDVSSFDVNAYPDCDFLWSNVGESTYYQASDWVENSDICSPVRTSFSLEIAITDIMDAVANNDGKFSIALKRDVEDQGSFTELSNQLGDHRLRLAVIGGPMGGATFAELREPGLTVQLDQSYPNPANPSATVTYSIRDRSHVTLRIYDVQGKLVRTLVDDMQDASDRHTIVWDGKTDAGHTASSGVYFYRLTAGDYSQTKKMVLLK